MSLSRRQVLQFGAAAMALPRIRASAAEPAGLLQQFGYDEVRLNGGPAGAQFQHHHELLLNLSEDSLLRPFRVREGLPAPGHEMGGWYSTWEFAPCHCFGQWVSTLARCYAATGNQASRAKVGRLVRGYAATIDPAGKFFVDNRFPAYVYDKLVIGLLDAHSLAGDPDALKTLARVTDVVQPFLPPKAQPHQETPLVDHEDYTRHCWDESYTMPENQFLAWRRTGDDRYLALAKRFLFDEYFDPLARGENSLPGRHAYSHVNALSSAAQAYLSLGDEKYLRTIRNAFGFIEAQSFVTGGWGPDEHFVPPDGDGLLDSLTKTHASFETPCGSYAHFKLSRYLLRITRDPHYGDSMERVFYNAVLGAKPLEPDGHAFYYSDYNFEGRKVFFGDKWPCCAGTLPQIASDYGISAYLRDGGNVYVNLFVPSTVTWQEGGRRFSLRQTTEYPHDTRIRVEITASRPATFSVLLRIPAWTKDARLSVSGSRGWQPAQAGAFAELRREWKTGDTIELELPMATRLEPLDRRHPDVVGLLSGPLVLFPLARPAGAPTVPRKSLLAAVRAPGSAREWRVETGGLPLRLKSFLDIADENYTTYVRTGEG